MSSRKRIIEGTWTCSSCDTAGIPGSEKVCSVCGNPRNDEEAKFDFGSETASGASALASVTDDSKLQLAAAGADWYCANCDTSNRGDAERCGECGTSDPAARLAKKPEKPAATPPVAPAPAPKKRGLTGCLLLLVLGMVFVCAGGICYFGFRKQALDGSITGVHWERSVELERFTPVTRQDWKREIPSMLSTLPKAGAGERIGADRVRDCRPKEKKPAGCEKVKKKEQCGTEEKCRKKDLGNGFAEETCEDVPKYCEVDVEECHDAVIEEWCTYDSYEWRSLEKQATKGSDNAPKWPVTSPTGPLDRTVKAGKYFVTVKYTDGGEPKTGEQNVEETVFSLMPPGTAVIVEVSALGGLDGVRLPDVKR
jgi:hypothetical protein